MNSQESENLNLQTSKKFSKSDRLKETNNCSMKNLKKDRQKSKFKRFATIKSLGKKKGFKNN